MRDNSLAVERAAAIEAVDNTQLAYAWCWERSACAGPYCAEEVCVGHARTADGLVLIIDRDLTSVTIKEYMAAYGAGAPCYILLKDGVERDPDVEDFIRREQAGTITRNFANLSELRTHITWAIYNFAVNSGREKMLQLRADRATRRPRPRARGRNQSDETAGAEA